MTAAARDDGSLTIAEVSESDILSRIFPLLPPASGQLLGPGDDAAVMAAADGRYVVTTDMMVHGPDFRLAWSTPFDLGWKAAATNLADVAAMGARPTGLVVALAVTRQLPVAAVTEFARGLRQACEALAPGCGVVGGDLSVSDTLTVAVTAFGDLEGRQPVLRSGARPGNVVALAGRVGFAATGLALLFERGVDDSGEPLASAAERLRHEMPVFVDAQLAPAPPIGLGRQAALAGATAMLDVSDGLSLDAERLARASGVRVDVSAEAVRAIAAEGNLQRGLRGGEDHALLATFPPSSVPEGFVEIGRVRSGSGVTVDDSPIDGVLGWDPYRGWDGGVG
ncbi:thiamine-phosphate kinase [Okibacterium endophyticum]